MEDQMRYGVWLEKWLTSRNGFVKEATFANYSMAVINHLIPTLGAHQLSELTEERLQETVLHWLASGRVDGSGGLAEKTVRDLLVIIKLSMKAAAKHYRVPYSSPEILFPKTERILPLKVLLPTDQRRLTQATLANLTPKNLGILLALYTGLRIGEVCALQWKDINLERRTLRVTKTIQRVFVKGFDGNNASRVIVSSPKTRASVREIPLATAIMPHLLALACKDADASFVTGACTFLEPRSYRGYFNRFMKRFDIPALTFHGLRHTFATRLIESGADVKTVSELLGHASVNTTLNLYVHPQMEQKRKCVELMAKF